MEQSKILKYALQHLSEKIRRLEDNIMLSVLSEKNRKYCEENIEKYKLEYDEIYEMYLKEKEGVK